MKVSSRTKQIKTVVYAKINPVFGALIHIVMAFVLGRLFPLPLAVPPVLQTIGFLIVILGFLLGIAALTAFRRARPTRDSEALVVRLVTFGIYRFTRNPVYLGFLLMLIGVPLNAGSYWGIILTPVMVSLFNRFVIEPEEENLSRKFGDEYINYKAKVRRWL